MAVSHPTAGAVLRRLAVGGSAVALAAVLFGAHPAGASTTGHGKSAQVTAHQHQSDQAKQAAKRAAERAKQAADAKQAAEAKRARADKAKADQVKKAEQAARKQAQQAAAAARQAKHAAAKASRAADKAAAKAQATAAKAQVDAAKAQAKAQAAVTRALRKAGLLPGNGDSGNGDNNSESGSGGQPVTPSGTGKSGAPTGHQQQPPVSTGKSGSSTTTTTPTRQSDLAGSVFVANSALAGSRSVPVSKPVQHLAAVKQVKQVKPQTRLATPPVKVLQVQTPIQLVQAGLSLGIGPMVLLGLVVVGGLATVIAGTRRRHSGQRN